MPVSKQRKEDKQRPYRIDYFLHYEMLRDKALVRSIVTRATTSQRAITNLAAHIAASGTVEQRYFTTIRAYRFYKKLSAEPKKKVYKPIDELLSAKKAIEVMTDIENRRERIYIRPEDLKTATIPDSVALTVVDPTTLPAEDPEHVCSDKCYDLVVVVPSEMKAVIERAAADTAKFAPCKHHGGKYIDKNGRCTAIDPNSLYATDEGYKRDLSIARTVEVSAPSAEIILPADNGQIEIPSAGGTFLGGAVVATKEGPLLPPLESYTDAIWPKKESESEALTFPIQVAPVILPPVACECGTCSPPYTGTEEYPAAEAVEDVVRRSKVSIIALIVAVAAIGGMVYTYLHYFAR